MNKLFGKQGKLWLFVTVAMLIALMVSGPVYAASNQIPFNGSFSGTVTLTSSTTAVLSGSGIADQLGLTAYAGNVSDLAPTPTGYTDLLMETLTAANGDTITILCHQVAVQKSPGVLEGTDQWMVVGGTGRFSGATGSGTGVTFVDLNKGTFSKQLIGTISAPAGN